MGFLNSRKKLRGKTVKNSAIKAALKILPIIGLGSTAFALMETDARLVELENKMSQVRTENAVGTYSTQTASARAEVDGEGFFIQGDILYWQARVGGTEYAFTDQDVNANLPVRGRTKDMSFDWDWGLRIGLGYNFEHGGWDMRAQYTWFDTNGSDSTRAGLNSTVIPLKGSSTITIQPNLAIPPFHYCASAKSQYDFDYSAIDLELGRAYFISGRLSFRPSWGLKTAWIEQEQIVRYTGGNPVLGPLVPTPFEVGLSGDTVHIKDDCDFWGVGPRIGFESKWHIGYGFSIFGNLNGALLYGFFDVEHEERYSAYIDNKIDIHANRHAFSPTAQMQIGLRHDRYIHNNKQHIGVGLGFEVEYWWRQNQMLKIDDSVATQYERYAEDISMHGLTLDIKWDF